MFCGNEADRHDVWWGRGGGLVGRSVSRETPRLPSTGHAIGGEDCMDIKKRFTEKFHVKR